MQHGRTCHCSPVFMSDNTTKQETPTQLERQIAEQVKESIAKAISERLSQGYDRSPLSQLIDRVVTRHSAELESIVSNAAATAFSQHDFKAELNAAFTHKLARVLVSKFEGEVEKRAVEIRANPAMRAKI